MNTRVRYVHGASESAAATTTPIRLALWIWVTQAFLGYEWLISGLNKLLNARFNAQLLAVLQQSAQGGSYGWYASFIRQVVLPNHTVVGVMTELGEASIGVVLLLASGIALLLPDMPLARYVRLAAAAALLGSIFLALNYFFQSNVPLPWINTNNSLNEGVDITILIALVSTALVAANVQAVMGREAVPVPVTSFAVRPEGRDIPA
jgi:uncharacterized membrane protein YphA (DoxX/SURF4 family)